MQFAKKWPKMVIQWPYISHNFFLQNCKKLETKKKVFYIIAFDLIKILKCWASQNDGQIFSFVKANNEVGKKITRNSVRKSYSQGCPIHFRSEFRKNLRSFSAFIVLQQEYSIRRQAFLIHFAYLKALNANRYAYRYILSPEEFAMQM